MLEKRHIIEVFQNAKKSIKQEDIVQLKELSNKTVHSASIEQDIDNIAIAVVLYALSKILERKESISSAEWKKFEKKSIEAIDNACLAIKEDDLEVFRDQIAEIREQITNLTGEIQKYVEDVFRKASINKASKLYEHGLSLEKTAKILGLTVWDLNAYVGQVGVGEVNLAYTLDLNKRIKLAEDIFKK